MTDATTTGLPALREMRTDRRRRRVAEIEWFDGPHTINGVGTFKFLHRHLNWPERN